MLEAMFGNIKRGCSMYKIIMYISILLALQLARDNSLLANDNYIISLVYYILYLTTQIICVLKIASLLVNKLGKIK